MNSVGKLATLNGPMSRRAFAHRAAVLGIGVASVSAVGWPASAAAKLTSFTWAGYGDKQFHKSYSAKYGSEPNFAIFSDEEEALQKVIGGFHPDLIHPCINSVGRFREAKVIKPIDTSRLTAWDRIFPALKKVKEVEVDGKVWIAPFDWGTSSVIYRSDLVHVSEESWHMLIDPQYKGKISFLDAPDNVAAIAGLLVGAPDPMNMNDDEMAKAEGVLRQLHANVRFYWTDQSAMEQAMASGEVVAAWGWASSVNNLTKNGVKVKYMAPKEGIMTWVCGLTLGADGPGDEQEKYDFIDAMLAPESGKALIEVDAYGHANIDSFKLADPKAVMKLGFEDPGKFLETGHFFEAVPAQKRKHIIDLWQNIRAGG
jgi:spermidine/putrescine transport system substrate-binding protein